MKELTKIAQPNYCNQMDAFSASQNSKANNLESKNFKQKLIKNLLQEVKRSTEILVRFNNQFFLEGIEKDSPIYKEYLIYESHE